MQTQTSIYIPKPCHEDWNKMTPTQQGKFCGSCNKQVIDFSLMSDSQILNFLSHQSGKLCGRFDVEQLERPLVEPKIKKKKSWWMALTMPLLFLFDRSEAQDNKVVGDTTYNASYKIESVQLIGAIAKIIPDKRININGKVVDENNKPLSFVTIFQKGTTRATTTDSLGNFSINVMSYEDSVTLTASYIGFSSIEKRIKISNTDVSNVIINLKEQVMGLNEVVVTSQVLQGRTAGGLSVCRRITTFEKIDSSFRKVIGISNVFPNPVLRGNSFHIQIKNAGDYQMQLLDNQSRLIQVEEINTVSNNSTKQIQLSSNTTAGIYYLRLINEQTKKSYTEKLIIQ
jgi:hypothetical protein